MVGAVVCGPLSFDLREGMIVSTGKAVDAADLTMKEGTVRSRVYK